jgi:2-C-methyl-D-erythritol 4-phosphate cytidylyltransferase
MFRYGMLAEALEACIRDGWVPTDEAAAMESRGHAVQVVEGRSDNLKITRPEDIALAEAILLQRSGVHT